MITGRRPVPSTIPQKHTTLYTKPKPEEPYKPPYTITKKEDPPKTPLYQHIFGKYAQHLTSIFNMTLHCLPEDLAPDRVHPIHHYFNIPSIIAKIQQFKQPPLVASNWKFARTIEAATFNSQKLLEHNFDLETATQYPPNTTLSYGSEFKPPDVLHDLISRHPHFPAIKSILDKGVTYPVKPITEEDRLNDIEYHLKRGNHQSSLIPENAAALDKAFTKEVQNRWALPLLPSSLKSIPNASVTPLGVAVQWTIDENRNRKLKRRTTHDCTFPGPSGLSCNLRILQDELEPCTYGHALLRFLHGIHFMRYRYPNRKIFMTKTDMDAAYRRIHTNMQAAALCFTVLNDIAYLLTRLPFGSSPAPPKFSIISDTATDIAQDISLEPSWAPSVLKSSFKLNEEPTSEPSDIPFDTADELIMNLPPRDIILDNFIDDIFNAGIDHPDTNLRLVHAVPLILETLFRRVDPRDANQRAEIINMTKHNAEGKLEECKIILGWKVNTRTFRLYLTMEKAFDWITDLQEIIDNGSTTKGKLESTIGRLNHTSFIVHLGKYFLTRLRYRLNRHSHLHKKAKIILKPREINDTKLWAHFLSELAVEGISINNICYTKPSSTTWSDACKWGMGGFTNQGFAWRYLLPPSLRNRASINLLEFMAACITIDLSLGSDTHNTQYPRIMAFTDSSSALGWLHHSTFSPTRHPRHDDVARRLAMRLFDHQATLYPTHIPGSSNVIADSLSRDFSLTDPNISNLIFNFAPSQQIPPHWQIVQIPEELSSWIASTLGSLPQSTDQIPTPSPSNLAINAGIRNSSRNVVSPIPSSIPSPPPKKSSSCAASPTSSEPTNTAKPTNENYRDRLWQPPSRMWFRPSGRTFGMTPPETRLETNQHSSDDN